MKKVFLPRFWRLASRYLSIFKDHKIFSPDDDSSKITKNHKYPSITGDHDLQQRGNWSHTMTVSIKYQIGFWRVLWNYFLKVENSGASPTRVKLGQTEAQSSANTLWWQLQDVGDGFGHFLYQHPLYFYIQKI